MPLIHRAAKKHDFRFDAREAQIEAVFADVSYPGDGAINRIYLTSMKRVKPLGMATALLLVISSSASAVQIIVGFESVIGAAKRVEAIKSLHGRVIREFHLINALVAVFPNDIRDADIHSLKGVTYVEEDKYLKWIEEAPVTLPLSSVENTLRQLRESNYNTPEIYTIPPTPIIVKNDEEIPWGVKRVNAPTAWPDTMGERVKVAVIDTGIYYTHPDLRDNYAGGYNAIISTAPPLDDHGHGTHVAGTIAAMRDFKGVVGVAPKARLYAVKVLNDYGSGQLSWIIAGIEWAVDNEMSVINMSLGGPPAESLAQAVAAAYNNGVVLVCAAGNTSGTVNYPAGYTESIAVSASDSSDKIAYFSSRGPEIDFIAPGVKIYSTYFGSSDYTTMSGTSMASPHVAGLAALAISLGADTPVKVKEVLVKAAVDLGLKSEEQGSGLIDASKLISGFKLRH